MQKLTGFLYGNPWPVSGGFRGLPTRNPSQFVRREGLLDVISPLSIKNIPYI